MNFPELVFSRASSVGQVKANLHRRTGTEPLSMEVWLIDPCGRHVVQLNQDAELLESFFPPENEHNGWSLKVIDTDATSLSNGRTLLDGDATTPKYVAARGDAGFAAFRAKCRQEAAGSTPVPCATTGMAEAAAFDDGDRVVVLASGHRGTVRYVGKCAAAAPGFFLGLELDERAGKTDGEFKGKRIFQCAPGHGLLLRPSAVRRVTHKDEDREEL